MKKLILGIASALLLSGAVQANDLKMATLPANLSQAITMLPLPILSLPSYQMSALRLQRVVPPQRTCWK